MMYKYTRLQQEVEPVLHRTTFTLDVDSSRSRSSPALLGYALFILLVTAVVLTWCPIGPTMLLSVYPGTATPAAAAFLSLPMLTADGGESELGELWWSRLDPLRVEQSEGYVGLLMNIAVLTGAADLPPLFLGLPCILPVSQSTQSAAAIASGNSSANCTAALLDLPPNANVTVTIALYRQSAGRTELIKLQQSLHTQPALQVSDAALSGASREAALAGFVSACVANGSVLCPLSSAAAALYPLVRTESRLYWVDGLEVAQTYTIAVSIANASHTTVAVNRSFRAYPQQQLFRLQTASLSAYLVHVTQLPPAIQGGKLAGFEDADAAAVRANHSSICPAAFLQFAAEYRQWHERGMQRLRAAGNDSAAVRAVLLDAADPVRVLSFGYNAEMKNAGLADRMVGIMSLYTLSLFSRRLFVLAAGWPELYMLAQFSLQLNQPLLAPGLTHPELRDITAWANHVNSDGGPLDRLNVSLPQPITWVATNRGIMYKLLWKSRDYAASMRQLGLTEQNLAGCVYHSLMVLRWRAVSSADEYVPALRQLLHLSTSAVGLQIRTGFVDSPHERNGQVMTAASVDDLLPPQVLWYFRCAQDITDSIRVAEDVSRQSRSRVVWLLVTDSQKVRTSAMVRYGTSSANDTAQPLVTVMMPALLGHAATTDSLHKILLWQHAMVEQFLFSLSQRHIISHGSGFGRLPSFMGMRRAQVYIMSPEVANRPSNCMDERAMSTVEQLGAGWSGI